MCMSKVTNSVADKKKRGKGWRVFRVEHNGKLHSLCKDRFHPRPRNRWLRATPCVQIVNDFSSSYWAGWHIFTTKKAALELKKFQRQRDYDFYGCYPGEYVVAQVEWRELLCEGIFREKRMLCAEAMKIISVEGETPGEPKKAKKGKKVGAHK